MFLRCFFVQAVAVALRTSSFPSRDLKVLRVLKDFKVIKDFKDPPVYSRSGKAKILLLFPSLIRIFVK